MGGAWGFTEGTIDPRHRRHRDEGRSTARRDAFYSCVFSPGWNARQEKPRLGFFAAAAIATTAFGGVVVLRLSAEAESQAPPKWAAGDSLSAPRGGDERLFSEGTRRRFSLASAEARLRCRKRRGLLAQGLLSLSRRPAFCLASHACGLEATDFEPLEERGAASAALCRFAKICALLPAPPPSLQQSSLPRVHVQTASASEHPLSLYVLGSGFFFDDTGKIASPPLRSCAAPAFHLRLRRQEDAHPSRVCGNLCCRLGCDGRTSLQSKAGAQSQRSLQFAACIAYSDSARESGMRRNSRLALSARRERGSEGAAARHPVTVVKMTRR